MYINKIYNTHLCLDAFFVNIRCSIPNVTSLLVHVLLLLHSIGAGIWSID